MNLYSDSILICSLESYSVSGDTLEIVIASPIDISHLTNVSLTSPAEEDSFSSLEFLEKNTYASNLTNYMFRFSLRVIRKIFAGDN